MILKRNYSKNKIIDLSAQNRQSRLYFYYINSIIPYFISDEDMISMSNAKKILHSTRFIYNGFTTFFNETNAVRMIQLICNICVFTWQMIFNYTNTWFAYFLTSRSGLKKIFQCIFTNPLYGLLFYGTFYIKLIGGTSDEIKFNKIAKILGLPKHSDMSADSTLSKIIDYLPTVITGDFEIKGYKLVTKNYLKTIASGIVSSGSQLTISTILIGSLKQANPQISTINNPAVYISERDRFDFDDTDIQDQLKFIKKEHNNIKKYVKKDINPKNKQLKKKIFMEIAQVKSPSGNVICLNKCNNRIKTSMGCYCEGDCGSTTFLGGKKWCWIDPEKCKKGKYLNTLNGRAYDHCDDKNLSKTKKCFNGISYTDCN